MLHPQSLHTHITVTTSTKMTPTRHLTGSLQSLKVILSRHKHILFKAAGKTKKEQKQNHKQEKKKSATSPNLNRKSISAYIQTGHIEGEETQMRM